jgi:hypothetical protein
VEVESSREQTGPQAREQYLIVVVATQGGSSHGVQIVSELELRAGDGCVMDTGVQHTYHTLASGGLEAAQRYIHEVPHKVSFTLLKLLP